MADWEPSAATSSGGGAEEDLASRTANVSAHLKRIYRKSVLPVEKRYQYDYFYESPFLTDVEFEGRNLLI